MTADRDPEGFEKKILHKFADLSNRRILEIGCGEGRLTWKYANASSITIGFDPDQDAVRIARAETPASLRGYVHLAQASASHIPFSKGTFDLAILAWSL